MTEQFNKSLELLSTYMLSYGMNVIGAIVTLTVGYLVSGWIAGIIDQAMRRAPRIDSVFHQLPGKIARVAILIFTLIAVLNRFGVETTSLIALLGAAGLAIGLALQGTLSNVAAGVMILFFRPFKIGDAVKLGGQVYVIDSLGFFICKGHLPEGPSVFIPNSQIWGQTIINLSVTDKDILRIDENYGISYSDNIDLALAILNKIVSEEPRILTDPAPLIKVDSLGVNAVNILFRVWTARADNWNTKLDLVQRCKEALEAGGCTFPFPQTDTHVYHQSGGAPADLLAKKD
jgi:small conductance mechanosensitive channel